MSGVHASLTITFNFGASISSENQTLFNNAKTFWEGVITGYQDGVSRVVTIDADTFDTPADENNVITLGSAGPSSTLFTGGFVLTSTGSANFNINAAATGGTGLLGEEVIRHEVGHILGIGTLWTANNVYSNGTGEYTGAQGLAGYNQEFGLSASFVPVELDGRSETANAHWNEATDNPSLENQVGIDTDPGDEALSGPTVVSGVNAGRNLDDALLTGLLTGDAFLSDTTIGSLRDIGFTTIDFQSVAVVPEPSTSALFASLGLVFCLRRKR